MSIESIIVSGRRLIGGTLLDTCFIQDRSLVIDSTGGRAETWTQRPKSTACRFVQPKDTDPAIRLDSVFGRVEMILLFPGGTAYEEGDRVLDKFDDSVWQIVKDLTVPSELQVIMRCGIRAI